MTSTIELPTTKSTNVRSNSARVPWTRQLLREGRRGLATVLPELTAAWAERRFLTPRRHARPESERPWAERAERGEVRYRTLLLPTYSWGSGPAVLLVHGWEGRGTQLAPFIPPLLEAGYRVVTVDLPGHGEAEGSLSSEADFALALRTIVPRLGPFRAVIAHSAGAAATALAYAFAPFDARLVLIGAPRSPEPFLAAFTSHLGLDALRDRIARRIELRYGLPLSVLDVANYGARVATPTLVVHDREDKEVSLDHADAFMRALPSATLLRTRGLGHRRVLRDPSVISAALAFIADAEGEPDVAPAALRARESAGEVEGIESATR